MSYSEAVTKDDLRDILNEILPISEISKDVCQLKATGIALPVSSNNTNTVFNPTTTPIVRGDTFTIDSNNRVVVNETCLCAVYVTFALSAVTTTSSLKVIGLGRNSEVGNIAMAAAGHPAAWDSVSGFEFITIPAGSQLHFTGRSNDGTATINQANIIIIRLS